MPCYHPLPAWRDDAGNIKLHKRPSTDGALLNLPCGKCIGCVQRNARHWALRCQLEASQHTDTAWSTLTYSDENLPPTLEPRDLTLTLKRLRKYRPATNRIIRFFASGEYGETTSRPHFHVIFFGLNARSDANLIEDKWGLGHVRTVPLSHQAIAYTAGYVAKKYTQIRDTTLDNKLVLDKTGTYLRRWQPEYRQMSRRPGIAAHAKKYTDNWRLYAVYNNSKISVPRYLHNAWQQLASPQQQEELEFEKYRLSLLRETDENRIKAAEIIALQQRQLQQQRRKYA